MLLYVRLVAAGAHWNQRAANKISSKVRKINYGRIYILTFFFSVKILIAYIKQNEWADT